MRDVLIVSVISLMVSIGMSLRVSGLITNWKRHSWSAWLRLFLATFVVPPAVVLLLHRLLPLNPSEAIGLFMVAVVPGAPLVTRAVARRGFDMHLAASYQVWGAVLTPVVIPLVVFAAAKLYDKDIWIPPAALLLQIIEKQFLPLLLGMTIAHFLPALSAKVLPLLNFLGNLLITLVMVALLWKMRAELGRVTPWLAAASFVLAASAILAIRLLLPGDRVVGRTLAICNANRHVGLALLLSGQYLHRRDTLPAVASYAILVALLMVVYPRLFGTNHLLAAEAAAAATKTEL